MRQRLAGLIGLILCFVMTAGYAGTAYAEVSWPAGVSVEADGAIVMDADTGAVLYGKNIDQQFFPASITKLLTAQVVLDHCQLDETVTFSRNAVYNVESGSKSLGMDTGDTLSVEDCLYGMLLHSANEVANALAEHTAGSIEEFAKLMNQKAKDLGCTNSNFVLPSGLNDDNHYTTPYDMALIAQGALKYPEIVKVITTRIYKIPPTLNNPDGRSISPGHKMLKELNREYYPEVFGGKTGYTSLAGNTLVTYAKKDGMTLVAVILNGHQTHYTDTKALLDFGFGNFQSLKITDYDTVYQSVKDSLTINGTRQEQALLQLDEESRITLPLGAEFSDAVSEISYDTDAKTPKDVVATLKYTYGGRSVGQAYLKMNPEAVALSRQESADGADDGQPSGQNGKKAKTGEESKGFPGKAVLIGFGILAVIGIGVFFFLQKRRREEEARSAAMRRKRREQWMRESGISAEEFNQLLEQRRYAASARKQRKKKR